MGKYKHFSDVELLAFLKDSDHSAYTEIYNRYFQLIFTHVNKKVQDNELAKDVVHDVFAYLWFRREYIAQVKDLPAYLFTAARNKVFDLFAHEKVEQKHYESLRLYLSKNPVFPTDHQTRERDFQAYIDKQIAELPPKMREVFELSRKEQLTYKEIAERLETSENNVSKQVNNAVRILRTKLSSILLVLL